MVFDSLFFSYKDVLLLRRMVSVLEFAAAVQHSWSFSIYTKHLEVATVQRSNGVDLTIPPLIGLSYFTHEAVEDVV